MAGHNISSLDSLKSLHALFEANALSRETLFSKTDFKFDVACVCGWSHQINKNTSIAYEATVMHFSKQKNVFSTSKRQRTEQIAHSHLGFYLKDRVIIADKVISKNPKITTFFRNSREENDILQPPLTQEVKKWNIEDEIFVYEELVNGEIAQLGKDVFAEEESEFAAARQICNEIIEEVIQLEIRPICDEESELAFASQICGEIVEEVIQLQVRPFCIEARAEREKMARDKESLEMEEQYQLDFIDSMDSTPNWVTEFRHGAETKKLTAVQESLMTDNSRNMFVDPIYWRYLYPTKVYYKLLSLQMSESDYENNRKHMPAPSERVLKGMDFCVLSDIEVSARNFWQGKEFYRETVS